MERETPTVPETATQIDVKLAAIGVVSGIVAAMAMDSVARLLGTLTAAPSVAKSKGPARSGHDGRPRGRISQARDGGLRSGDRREAEPPDAAVARHRLPPRLRSGDGRQLHARVRTGARPAARLRHGLRQSGLGRGRRSGPAGRRPREEAERGSARHPRVHPRRALGLRRHARDVPARRGRGAGRLGAVGNVIDVAAEPMAVAPASGAVGAAGPT